ncbi:hypothetical protein ACO0LF_29915 [Undibacterium sp. Di27W]|uniref:hypothetical protein n=1 Tax=Undibacterium sp. Di27W TaxID=3413036 RepID=UPI003BF3EC3F
MEWKSISQFDKLALDLQIKQFYDDAMHNPDDSSAAAAQIINSDFSTLVRESCKAKKISSEVEIIQIPGKNYKLVELGN